jgi:predicted nucleic acid-binding protein
MYLLSSWPEMQSGLLEWLELGSIKLATLEAEDMPRVRELMTKYRDRHIDFADAALVRVAERDKLRRIFTVDKKDFNVYRIMKTGRFSVLP